MVIVIQIIVIYYYKVGLYSIDFIIITLAGIKFLLLVSICVSVFS